MRNKTTILSLKPAINQTYSVINILVFVSMILLVVYILLNFQNRLITGAALLFVPLAILIFLFKILIWLLFGKETISIEKDKVVAQIDYKYIYAPTIKTFNYNQFSILLKSNKSEELLTPEQATSSEHKGDLFKICLKFTDTEYFESAVNLDQEGIKDAINKLT